MTQSKHSYKWGGMYHMLTFPVYGIWLSEPGNYVQKQEQQFPVKLFLRTTSPLIVITLKTKPIQELSSTTSPEILLCGISTTFRKVWVSCCPTVDIYFTYNYIVSAPRNTFLVFHMLSDLSTEICHAYLFHQYHLYEIPQ